MEGDYIYSGEGKSGDQSMTRGNLAIKNAAADGKALHLFVKFSPREYYYQGVLKWSRKTTYSKWMKMALKEWNISFA